MKIGVVGVGIMGSAIAANLLRKGAAVAGYDIDECRMSELAAAGGVRTRSAGEAADHAEVLLTSLPSAAALAATVTALLEMPRAGLVVAELSTLPIAVKLDARDRLATAGIALLDCPLSGTGAQAVTGDLAVYASGDRAAYDRALPVFEKFARASHYLGAFGNGSKMKFIANLLVAIHNVATAEAMVLGLKAGLDPAEVVRVIASGAGTSKIFELRAPLMARRDYAPTMKVDIWQKDMAVIAEFAASLGVTTPLFTASIPVYNAAQTEGHGGEDTAAVCAVLERLAGSRTRPMTSPRRLIVGSAGGTNAFGTIRSVRDRYGDAVFVIATDTNPRELVAASALSDDFVQMPPARAPEFLEALGNLAATYPSSHYLPLHDEEIMVAAQLAAEGRFPGGLVLIAAPYEVVRLCWDKWETHRWLLAQGLPSPETALATPAALEGMRRPVILKPRGGTAGANFPRVRSVSDLAGIDPTQWMLQEQLQTPQVTVEGFLAQRGHVFRCVTREFLEAKQSGPIRKARVYDDPELTGLAERLARGMPLLGAFNFEAMRDRAGAWRIIDVHTRVSVGTRMCAAIGVDIAAAALADFWGEDVSELLPPLSGEYYVARQYEEYVTRRPPVGEPA